MMLSEEVEVCAWHRKLLVEEYNLGEQLPHHFCLPRPGLELGLWRNIAA